MIGCPSMFMHGERLPEIKKTELTSESIVCINRKLGLPKKLHDFFVDCGKRFPNYYFLPQNTFDYQLLYAGVPITETKRTIPENYPAHYLDPAFLDDHVRGFVNVPSWLTFLSQATFNFGSRIHGNIAGVLAGCPSYIFAPDARVLELAEYHHIPHMLAKEINADTDIYQVYEQTDFDVVHQGHRERFAHYINFLNKNGLTTVWDKGGQADKILPFDAKMRKLTLEPPIIPFVLRDEAERMNITENYYRYFMAKQKALQSRLNKVKRESAKAKRTTLLERIRRQL